MTMELEKDPRYEEAKKQVEEEKGFYIHLSTYVLVNAFFVVLDFLTSPGHWWFYWPMLGWGIGVVFHWIGVFGKRRFFSEKWEERRIRKLMDEDNRQQ